MSRKLVEMQGHMEKLTEEELQFCWRCLVDGGQLTVPKLQEFFDKVCGQHLPLSQANDLLNYMDSSHDGRVGMEEFKFFMQVGCLEETDAQTFMWAPHRRKSTSGLELRALREEQRAHTESYSDSISKSSKQAVSGSQLLLPDHARHKLVVQDADHNFNQRDAQLGKKKKKKKRATKIDDQVVANIEAKVANYESKTWMELLDFERDFSRRLLRSHASEITKITLMEYHKMLQGWARLAEWHLPGEVRTADTLAALESLQAPDSGYARRGSARGSGEFTVLPGLSLEQFTKIGNRTFVVKVSRPSNEPSE